MAKFLTICLISFTIIWAPSCTKKPGENTGKDSLKTTTGEKSGDKSTGDKTEGNKTEGNKTTQPAIDSFFFGQWAGKKILVDDNYKYAENEKNMTSKEGSDYFAYGEKLKGVINKFQKYDEKNPEYSFTEYKEDFAPYTSLKQGRKMYAATTSGVYPMEVNGYLINMDDMIGSGKIFYATAPSPSGAKLEEREIMLFSYNSNMTKLSKPLTEQSTIDKFAGYVMPKLKGITIMHYDEKTGKENKQKLEKLTPEDIKVFKGSFTGAGKNEYLVGVKFNNEATSFTSASWVMDEGGKVIAEFSPFSKDNFTFSELYLTGDFNGDGIDEIITSDGYYEGGAYNLNRYVDGHFILLTTGFMFGV